MIKKHIWVWVAGILLAVILWLQNVLLSEQQETITVPLIIDPQPRELIMTEEKEPVVECEMQAKGVHILLFKYQNIFYRVDGSKLKYGMNSIHLNKENLSCSLKQMDYIQKFTEKVKLIEMDKIISMPKPVNLTFSSNVDKQYFMAKKMDIGNNQVIVTGPKKLLEDLESIDSEPVTRRDLTKGKLRISLQTPSGVFELKTEELVVNLNIKSNSIKTISLIPIVYKGDKEISYSPQKATIMLEGKEEEISKLKTDDILVELIIPDGQKDGYGSLKFKLPDNMILLEYTPEKVLFTSEE